MVSIFYLEFYTGPYRGQGRAGRVLRNNYEGRQITIKTKNISWIISKMAPFELNHQE